MDASSARLTGWYIRALTLLGGDRAAGRLAGFYALERLGQVAPEHRKTVVDVICDYLRLPFRLVDWDEPDP